MHLTFDFAKFKELKQHGEFKSDGFSLSCKVDGFLESMSTFQNPAILEAKVRSRSLHEPEVTWQETIEVVAALLRNPNAAEVRFHLDHKEDMAETPQKLFNNWANPLEAKLGALGKKG